VVEEAPAVPKIDAVKANDEKPVEVTINVTVNGNEQPKPVAPKKEAPCATVKADDRIKKITL